MRQRDQNIYASAPLRRLLDDQMRVMAPDLQRCFGAHALLVGPAADDAPPARSMLNCWTRLQVDDGGYRGDLQAAWDEPLPFINDAFELVLLRHALEVVPAPSALLAEAVRVLAPGGVLMLTGVHPFSGWAPWLYWRARGTRPVLRFPLQLMHSLQRDGLDIERTRRVGRLWPATTPASAGGSNALGGGYVLVARKRHRAATPLRIKPVPMRVPANGQLSPGTRRSSAL